MDEKIKVYAKPDEQNRIIASNSSVFLDDITGWVQIDEGLGDKFSHAQNLYFDKPVVDMRGCFNYKLVDGKPVERTEEEKQGDIVPPPKSKLEILQETVDALVLSGLGV